jgi:hypothetical protein
VYWEAGEMTNEIQNLSSNNTLCAVSIFLAACSPTKDADFNAETQIVELDKQKIESAIEYPPTGTVFRGFVVIAPGFRGRDDGYLSPWIL